MLNSVARRSAGRSAFAVGIAFFAYFVTTALLLPYGAGPDYDAHFDGARFIYSEGRLAVLPDDAEKLHFTAYGSTRALRPPLPYLVSASAAQLLSWTGIELRLLFRVGSALLCALTVAIAYLTLARHFASATFGLTGALLIGLMPQFTFIASHLNDDSAAIFSVTFLIYCITRFFDRPVDPRLALLTGIAIGLVLISKFTAWLFLPFAGLAMVICARPANGRWVLALSALVIGVLVGGGWWLAFNVWHYGWDDPLLFKIGSTISATFTKIDPGSVQSFSAEGVSFAELVFGNYKNFVDESLASAIGNLDWLRLRVGLPQYLIYTVVLTVGMLYVPFRWLVSVGRWIRGNAITQPRRLILETLLFLAVVFQFFVYAVYQWLQEIQVQGKYMLPTLMAVTILFFAAMDDIRRTKTLRRHEPKIAFGGPSGRWHIPLLPVLAVCLIIAVHADAMRRFVIPFYHPPAKMLGLGAFTLLDLGSDKLVSGIKNAELNASSDGWRITSLNADSQIFLDPQVCELLKPSGLIEIKLISDGPGILQLFWSGTRGFIDRIGESSTRAVFDAGENTLLMAIGVDQCRHLRLDPTNIADQTLLIRSIAIAPLVIRPFPYYLRLFGD
jgi:hypothetical protein